MEKDFDLWNEKKKELSRTVKRLFFKEGEIWWCSIGLNIGEEVYGKGSSFRRPVIILRKLTSSSCIAIPLTSKERTGNWYYEFKLENFTRYAMLHQIKMVSSSRFESRMTVMLDKDFEKLKKTAGIFYGLL